MTDWTEQDGRLTRPRSTGPGVAAASAEVTAAVERLAGTALRTPCVQHPAGGRDGWFKLENLQRTGSFKLRGAANRIAADPAAKEKGVVTASSGNHGRAVAEVSGRLGVAATVCVPDWVDPLKRKAIEGAGARIVLSGPTYEDAEEQAEKFAEDGLVFVRPFDDPLVIAGQATIGVELSEQLPADVRTVYVAVSGGGLAAGVALGLRSAGHAARVVGVCAAGSPSMYESVRAGKPVPVTEHSTLASALSGGIGLTNEHTFALVEDLLEELFLVSEEELADAVRFAATELHQVVEGGGATSLAGWLRDGRPNTACVISGGNIDPAALAAVLAP